MNINLIVLSLRGKRKLRVDKVFSSRGDTALIISLEGIINLQPEGGGFIGVKG